MKKTAEQPCRFGAFVFEPRTFVLKRDAQIVQLKQQSAAVLSLLIENAGDVVTRDTIRDTIWHDRTIEFDHGINACIRDIRRVLDDDAKEPQYIETLPKIGYRFKGEVSKVPDRPILLRRFIAMGIVAGLLALVATYWLFVSAPGNIEQRLAVMPFRSTVDGVLATGHLNDLSMQAARSLTEQQTLLKVISVAELFGDPDRKPGMGDVSRWLDVDYLVAGNITQDNGIYSLNLRLIRTDGYTHVWSQSATFDDENGTQALNILLAQLINDIPAAIQ